MIYIIDIYHDIIMIFSSENIVIYINENISGILLWFTYFYNFDKFETPLVSLINSAVVVVCWMLIAEPIIFFCKLRSCDVVTGELKRCFIYNSVGYITVYQNMQVTESENNNLHVMMLFQVK